MRLFFIVCFCLFANTAFAQEVTTSATQPAPNRSGFRILPVPGYSPETTWSLTVGALYFFGQPDGDSTSRLNQLYGGVQYTLRNQFVVGIFPELYFNHENIRLFGEFEASRYPDFFYGVQ